MTNETCVKKRTSFKGEKVKRLFLEAAVSLIAEKGNTEKVSMNDIADKAGLPVQKLIYYYRNRQGLLSGLGEFLQKKAYPTPISAYLENNRNLLSCREGQILFINELFCFFREFFRDISEEQMNECRTFRAMLNSRETPDFRNHVPCFYLKDFSAFCEIHKIITKTDDINQAAFWYACFFDSLAQRLSDRAKPDRLDDEHIFQPDFDIRFLHFCCRKILIGLGLGHQE